MDKLRKLSLARGERKGVAKELEEMFLGLCCTDFGEK
jgi:hypothetical protein